ncbi:thiosulfate reductase cytochrome B subunit (membrane anchoring protein) [Desulfosporosinus acidiphilus SJ4]|uniref:Thiosulfate reductase cytochrome B subunit (Membrane anchoring protein) n=1 Tax=Desulfosporosinus acidiphilus (strain DSM 22704 / JCM 16185 / SJ4) TaxID=646529 RepID=I4D1D5_DESAJ|nr:cytochrome b/b6 domain-containing protein [Desulfosporosinus acidiphilus]AFM39609.1 thiosulfate reductase cytochrome B subunit (membrane anchoring protein) [Desulfosporosinus acidiphilus SJ4]
MKHKNKLRKTFFKELQKGKVKGEIILFQPLLVRIFHWGFAVSLTGILLSGLELHKPAKFLAVSYGDMFEIHVISSWFALGFVALRCTDAILRQDQSLIPKLRDFKVFPKLVAYYLFLRPAPPLSRKYNSGQSLIYFSWLPLFLIASLLGLSSYWHGEHLIWVWRLVGGFQRLRWIKFSITIYFLATISLHIYLSITENLSHLQAMVSGYERKPPPKRS